MDSGIFARCTLEVAPTSALLIIMTAARWEGSSTWMNGVQILEHVEPKSVHPARGHIGLQIHGGARSRGTMRYRNIRVRSL